MIVYMVTSGEYSSYRVEGLFINKILAERFANDHYGDVEEMTVLDQLPTRVPRHWAGVELLQYGTIKPLRYWVSDDEWSHQITEEEREHTEYRPAKRGYIGWIRAVAETRERATELLKAKIREVVENERT